jgi:hypothetical protein
MILKNKYLNFKPLSQVKKYSSFWRGFMKIKDEFFERGPFTNWNGEETRLWEDTWLGDSLVEIIPILI